MTDLAREAAVREVLDFLPDGGREPSSGAVREAEAIVDRVLAAVSYDALRQNLTEATHDANRCGEMARERDFWKRRYEEQHRTVHSMEDTIARLREAAQAVVDGYPFSSIGSIGLPGRYYQAMVALRAALSPTTKEQSE